MHLPGIIFISIGLLVTNNNFRSHPIGGSNCSMSLGAVINQVDKIRSVYFYIVYFCLLFTYFCLLFVYVWLHFAYFSSIFVYHLYNFRLLFAYFSSIFRLLLPTFVYFCLNTCGLLFVYFSSMQAHFLSTCLLFD